MAKEYLTERMASAAAAAAGTGRPVFLEFCEPAVQYLADREIARHPECDAAFFGGHEHAERRMLCVFAKGSPPDESDFPIEAIQAPAGDFAHPDVLGALISAGAAREGIGDINFASGIVQVILKKPLGELMVSALTRIASDDVLFAPAERIMAAPPVFTDMDVIVSSLRVDTLVHAAYRLSRAQASEFVRAGRVLVNHKPVLKPSLTLKESDVVSVRSKGRFIVDLLQGSTKKGNYRLRLKKYA